MITQEDLNNYAGDKRSKEYRELKEAFASQNRINGLGDVVEAFTKATGIKAIVDKVSDVLGVDCGCDERRERLNNLLPRGRKQVRCMTDEEYTEYGLFIDTRKAGRLEADEVKYLMTLYTKIYNRKWAKVRCTQCALKGRVKEAMSDLDRTYNNHNQ
tara:strand:- start:224 stop:694 length:471 start_codon:yes stop_codon:yes gene_type:complete